ncbi:MAG TPA: HD domain-containing protein [Acidobacteria bacterium]|nr:HD domain-containing protein [Acidobacteriota bacterium]
MEALDLSQPCRSRWYQVAGCVLIFWACALLNGLGGLFQIAGAVSFVYPASAAAVLGGLFFGWWGVAAVFLGYAMSPWGIAEHGFNALILSSIGTLQAIIPAIIPFPPKGSSFVRTRRFFLFAVILNTLISAIMGIGYVAWVTKTPLVSHSMAAAFLGWFLGDGVAICLLAVPVVLMIRPQLLISEDELSTFQSWLHRSRCHLLLGIAILTDAGLMELTAHGGFINIHWLGALLLGPVLVAATAGGTAAGLLTSAVAGTVYVIQALRLVQAPTAPLLLGEMLSAYINIGALIFAAIVAGGYAARTRSLVQVLEDQRGQLQHSFESVVTGLAAAIEAKDPTTEGHVQRVARMAVRVGRQLGITGQRLEILRYAAILHDIGKIGVPESLLNKPGELDPEEQARMEDHVNIGVDIIENVELLAPAIPFIRYHQERWDGATTGRYPGYFGLKGEEIPLEARIISVVDAFDAMTNDRPYRRALTLRQAIAELRKEAGRQFDPTVVGALLALITGEPDSEPSGRWPVLEAPTPPWGRPSIAE